MSDTLDQSSLGTTTVSHSVPSHSTMQPQKSVTATIDAVTNTGNAAKETNQASVDLTNAFVIHTTPSIILPTPTPHVPAPAAMAATATSTIPNKVSQAYALMHELLVLHQVIITIEDNSDNNDLLDLQDIVLKNKHHCTTQVRKMSQ